MIIVRYKRPQKEAREWEHRLLLDTDDIIISDFEFKLEKPFSPFGEPLIYSGYKGMLFDHLDKWYNVLEVRDEKGGFKGYYSDIRTPPVRIENGYEALDLILDVWVYPDGKYVILDQDEFKQNVLPNNLKEAALLTLDKLKNKIVDEGYPPSWVRRIKDEL